MKLSLVAVVAALALAGATGYFAATALSQAGEPTRTVTIDVATGPQGPAGPPGPPGPSGLECIQGYQPGVLVVNHPGGQTRIYTCLGAP